MQNDTPREGGQSRDLHRQSSQKLKPNVDEGTNELPSININVSSSRLGRLDELIVNEMVSQDPKQHRRKFLSPGNPSAMDADGHEMSPQSDYRDHTVHDQRTGHIDRDHLVYDQRKGDIDRDYAVYDERNYQLAQYYPLHTQSKPVYLGHNQIGRLQAQISPAQDMENHQSYEAGNLLCVYINVKLL